MLTYQFNISEYGSQHFYCTIIMFMYIVYLHIISYIFLIESQLEFKHKLSYLHTLDRTLSTFEKIISVAFFSLF